MGIVRYCKEHPYEALLIGAGLFCAGLIIGECVGIEEGKEAAGKITEKVIEKVGADPLVLEQIVDKAGTAGGHAMLMALYDEHPTRDLVAKALANGYLNYFDTSCETLGVCDLVESLL